MATMNIMKRCSEIAGRAIASQRAGTPISMTSSIPSSSPSIRVAHAAAAAIEQGTLCGRGDKKTKRGKRFKGTYGNSRPKRKQMIQRIKDKIEVPRSTPWPLPFKLI